MPNNKPLTTGKIARYCNVNQKTVLKWIDEGTLPAYQLPSGSNRITVDNFITFLKEHAMPIPHDLSTNGHKRVLIVDDSVNLANTLTRMLHLDDMEVAHALDGFEAGLKVDNFRPDLILLDIHMPRMDGYEVVKHLKSREETAHIKIVILSGNVTYELKQNLKDYGVTDVIEKPFSYDQLREVIRTALV